MVMKGLLSINQLSHRALMSLMPPNSGYACNKKGEPCPNAVTLACALNALQMLSNPYLYVEEYEN